MLSVLTRDLFAVANLVVLHFTHKSHAALACFHRRGEMVMLMLKLYEDVIPKCSAMLLLIRRHTQFTTTKHVEALTQKEFNASLIKTAASYRRKSN